MGKHAVQPTPRNPASGQTRDETRATGDDRANARARTWEGLRAAVLSAVPGVGHLYLGEKKGYLVLAFALGLLVISRVWWPPAELLYLSVAIFSAVDAYSIAKRGHGLT